MKHYYQNAISITSILKIIRGQPLFNRNFHVEDVKYGVDDKFAKLAGHAGLYLVLSATR